MLRFGGEAVEFRAMAGGALEVTATSPRVRLLGNGTHVRLTSTTRGVGIRTD